MKLLRKSLASAIFNLFELKVRLKRWRDSVYYKNVEIFVFQQGCDNGIKFIAKMNAECEKAAVWRWERHLSNGRRTILLHLATCIQIFRFVKKTCCPFPNSLSGKVKFFRHALMRICTYLLKYVSRGRNVQWHHVAAKSLSVITLYHLELGKNVDFAVEIFQYQEIFYY